MIVVPPFAQSARNNTQASAEIAKRARNAVPGSGASLWGRKTAGRLKSPLNQKF
jgi:hypothetical protein